jgi:MoaD family protein
LIIRVKGYLTFRKLVGDQSVEVGAEESLRMLLRTLAVKIGDPFGHQVLAAGGGLQEGMAVLVNGRSYKRLPQGLETRLQDGDEVAIFPPLMGG